MIIEFSVKNFRSIRELQTISFLATGLKSPESEPEVDKNNISEINGIRFLKTVGIYGSNASGKSNIIRALEYFLKVIRSEANPESNLKALFDPFLYQDNASETESFFQIVVLIEGKKVRYGFTVKKNPDFQINPISNTKESPEIISSEWLYGTKGKNTGLFFIRKNSDIEKDKLPNKDKIPPLPSKHVLFLTHAAAFDRDGVCFKVRDYLIGWTISNFSNGVESFRWISILALGEEKMKKSFINLLSSFNLLYDDIIIEKDGVKDDLFYRPFPIDKIFLKKSYHDSTDRSKELMLNLSYHESSGTQRLFDLAGLLLRTFDFYRGALIILDEVDSNFHPSLLIKLIELFNNPEINKSNSQLLFTSHDTNLLSPSIMRRDQFYFTEKNGDDSTRLYSLAELKGIRNDADFARQYLAGFYGALPLLESYSGDKN